MAGKRMEGTDRLIIMTSYGLIPVIDGMGFDGQTVDDGIALRWSTLQPRAWGRRRAFSMWKEIFIFIRLWTVTHRSCAFCDGITGSAMASKAGN
jgi:hypothetical protein